MSSGEHSWLEGESQIKRARNGRSKQEEDERDVRALTDLSSQEDVDELPCLPSLWRQSTLHVFIGHQTFLCSTPLFVSFFRQDVMVQPKLALTPASTSKCQDYGCDSRLTASFSLFHYCQFSVCGLSIFEQGLTMQLQVAYQFVKILTVSEQSFSGLDAFQTS